MFHLRLLLLSRKVVDYIIRLKRLSRVHLPVFVVREGLVVLSGEQQCLVVLVSIGKVARRPDLELVLGDGQSVRSGNLRALHRL